ncbi:small G protein signaling modulator 3 isoform X10 [Thraustotheca clavata]|uniref:Small G protein signaling modulator 3 isoform X10 n=1 Tax=Thraustotheca clavata TaxID=74557 RepID=A0A1V9ZZZ1_9STRA|nr:small G protein signaling modulator 3 isoform X10 [Thraustotheca clavata]
MWSYAYNGKQSIFGNRQRILFSIASNDNDRKQLKRVLNSGSLGIYIEFPDDSTQLANGIFHLFTIIAIVLVKKTIQEYIQQSKSQRKSLSVICECSHTWSRANLIKKIDEVVKKLDIEYLDGVLLPSSLLPVLENNLLCTEDATLAWQQLIQMKQHKLCKHIGVSDFSTVLIEILLHRFPNDPVEIHCLHIHPFQPETQAIRFAHSKQIDVIAKAPLVLPDTIAFNDKANWLHLSQEISQNHTSIAFKQTLPFETIQADTTVVVPPSIDTFVSNLKPKILVKWLIQRGLSVIPYLEADEPYDEEMCQTIFSLVHPFVDEIAQISPSKPYQFSSFLRRTPVKKVNEPYPVAPLVKTSSRKSCTQMSIPEVLTSSTGELHTEEDARVNSLQIKQLRFGDIIELHAISAFEGTSDGVKESALGFLRWSPSEDIQDLQHVLVVPPVDPTLFITARFVIAPTRDDTESKIGTTFLKFNQEFVLELAPQTTADCTNIRPPKSKYSLNNKTPTTNDVISAQPRHVRVSTDPNSYPLAKPDAQIGNKGELHVIFRKPGTDATMSVCDGDGDITIRVMNSNRHRTCYNNDIVQYPLDMDFLGGYLCCEQERSIFSFTSSRPSTKPITQNSMDFVLDRFKASSVRSARVVAPPRWYELSGAQAKAHAFPPSHYANLQQLSRPRDPNVQQIDRDIERTMLYDTATVEQRRLGIATASCRPANVPMLRRVLVAASWHLNDVGYCQSMDIICAFLLQYLDEEDAFWILVTLVEDILPGYYTPTLEGIQVDQLVFQQLVEEFFPQLTLHLENLGAGVSLLCFHWFLCLYVNVLSTQVTELAWALLFEDGPHSLFQIGLRILLIAEQELMACENSVELLETLQDVAVQLNPSLFQSSYDGMILKREIKDGPAISPIPSPSPLSLLHNSNQKSTHVRKTFDFYISKPCIDALRRHYTAQRQPKQEDMDSIGGFRLVQEEKQWPKPISTKFQSVQRAVLSFKRVSAQEPTIPPMQISPPSSVDDSPHTNRSKKKRNFELNLPRTLKPNSAKKSTMRLKSRVQSLPEIILSPGDNRPFHIQDLKALHTSILDMLMDDQKNRWRWERQNAKLEWVGYSALSGAILEGSKKGNVSQVSLKEERLDTYGSFSLPEETDVLVDLVQMIEHCEITGRVSKVRRVRGLDGTSVYDVPLEVQTIQRVWNNCAASVHQSWDSVDVRNMLMTLMQPNDTILLRDIVIGLAIASEGPPKERLEAVLNLFNCYGDYDTLVLENEVMHEIIRGIYSFCYDGNVHEKTFRFLCFLLTFVNMKSMTFWTFLDLLALHFQLVFK